MPAEGIKYLPKKEVLSFEEIERLITVMATMGISKIRLTGGEPFVRNDLMKLIQTIVEIPGIDALHLTTNGVLTAPHIPQLKKLGIASVNLSLDTLDKERFRNITLRDEFESTWKTLNLLLEEEIPTKINVVVMEGKNIEDILPMVEMTKHKNVSVRFIEEMPFNGGSHLSSLHWNYKNILNHIKASYPALIKVQDEPNATAYHYKVPGHHGSIGIIAAYSRTFCGSCNRIRVTAQGTLKTCLYDEGVLDIKKLMRSGASDTLIATALMESFSSRALDGFEAEKKRVITDNVHESMSTIGG
jgi:molybdenum cofactor biosynthesis protein A